MKSSTSSESITTGTDLAWRSNDLGRRPENLGTRSDVSDSDFLTFGRKLRTYLFSSFNFWTIVPSQLDNRFCFDLRGQFLEGQYFARPL